MKVYPLIVTEKVTTGVTISLDRDEAHYLAALLGEGNSAGTPIEDLYGRITAELGDPSTHLQNTVWFQYFRTALSNSEGQCDRWYFDTEAGH